MGDSTNSLVGGKGARPGPTDPAELRARIADTRDEMSITIEQLHGRLNPVVLKDQAIEQFHEATATVKAELKAHFSEAKEAMKAELKEAKQSVKTELVEAKVAIKSEVLEQLDAAKTRLNEEMSNAKTAVRDATIGKVENMIHNAKDKARDAGKSFVDVVRDNPVPAALAGIGLVWLFIGGRRTRAGSSNRMSSQNRLEAGPEGEGMASRAAHGIQHAASAGAHQISELAHGAGSTIAGATHTAASAVGHAAGAVGHAAGAVGHAAATQGRRVQQRTSELYRLNPVAVGAAMLAVGAAVGLAIPRTRMEDDLVGSARDGVMDKVQELAHSTIGKADDAAQHLFDDASDALHH